MDDQERQELIIRQSCMKAAATTLAIIAKDSFKDADAAASFVEALTNRYEQFIWNGKHEAKAAPARVEQHPRVDECPKHPDKTRESKDGSGYYCSKAIGKKDDKWVYCDWRS